MRVGMLYSRIRPEEKLLIQEMERRGLALEQIDVDATVFPLNGLACCDDVEVVLERCVSHTQALYATKILEDRGVRIVNPYDVISNAGDKLVCSLLMEQAGIPTPTVRVAFTEEAALRAIEEIGYPVVLKPTTGSWGRLIAKASDPAAAEALLEHKRVLGTYHHSVYYIQQYVEKPGRDIRAFYIGDRTVCAIYRNSPHWITNTARGGRAECCPVSSELDELCTRAAGCVGGGILALDVFEKDDVLVVNEINPTMEFRNSIDTTGVNIPGLIIDYLVSQAAR